MRRGNVFYKDHFAGVITETDDGDFIFQYDEQYVNEHPSEFITLIPEGWLLDIASKNWKINRSDRMGLLLACCRNCIGAVSVNPIPVEDGA